VVSGFNVRVWKKKERKGSFSSLKAVNRVNITSCACLFPRLVCVQDGYREEVGIRDVMLSNPTL